MARPCVILWSIKILNKNNLWCMVLASSTNLIKYTKIRWVGFNTDQSHSWLLLQLIQIDWLHSVSNSFAHCSVLYSVRWDEMCRIGLSYKHSKILEWSECGRKARHKKWIEKKSFWHAWDMLLVGLFNPCLDASLGLNPHTHESIIFLHHLEVLVQVLQGSPSPSFARCCRWTGAWPW